MQTRLPHSSVLVFSALALGGALALVVGVGAAVPGYAADDRSVPTAATLVERLRGLGVALPRRTVGDSAPLHLVPVLAQALRADVRSRHGSEPGTGPNGTIARAGVVADAHEASGAWLAAAWCHSAAGNPGRVRELLDHHGETILRAGGAADLVHLVEQSFGTDPERVPATLRLRQADARRMAGDPDGAHQALTRLGASAASGGSAGLAVRRAAVAYLRGDFESAATELQHWPGPGPDLGAATDTWGEDLVDWLATLVHVQAMRARPGEAAQAAQQCRAAAERLAQPRALGVSHLALARTLTGARKQAHHDQALRHAITAGDAQTAGRVLAAQTFAALAGARYAEAVPIAREALRVTRICSPPGMQATAVHNLGEALARVGEFDEARWHLECAVAVCRPLGPARTALALVGLGDLHRTVGHEQLAHLAYTEAIELSAGSGDIQVLVPAWSGLALLGADEPTRAHERAVVAALCHASPALLPSALTALGRLALGAGQRHTAQRVAARAVATAREQRAVDLLAEALELAGRCAATPEAAREPFEEALAIWTAGGAAPAVARVRLLLGRLPGADPSQRSQARAAVRELRTVGIQRVHGRPVAVAGDGVRVSIRVLGPFVVYVDGAAVPLPAWRSRQARLLVKILVAQRGRAISRERLCDLLWPDDDPARTGHRLSVLLNTVRRVLDPERAAAPDQLIVADTHGVRLDLEAVDVDSETLLRDAAHAQELLAAGAVGAARELLEHVDAGYAGPAFDDEPDADWADGVREQVRAAWIRSIRRLITVLGRQGSRADTVTLLVRLLDVDPYDDEVHRRLVGTLVALGRHGEARRAFTRWRRAMREIDAPPPDPALLGPGAHLAAGRSDRTLTAS